MLDLVPDLRRGASIACLRALKRLDKAHASV